MPAATTTQNATVETAWSPLFQRELPNVEGKTFTSVIIEFPPSAGTAPHRHGAAFVWAYVLAGTIRIKLNDEPTRTCREGESWFEEPSTHHLLAENTSATEPAKVLAVFISNPGDPLKVDEAGKPDSLGPRLEFGGT
jgi:quercetin dioxygenase-like cupin family protein